MSNLFAEPGKPNAPRRPEYGRDGRLTRRGMEQVIEDGGGVLYHGLHSAGPITSKENVPSEEEYALLGTDPLDDDTLAGYTAWCNVHIRKLKELIRLNPQLATLTCNPSCGFVRAAGHHGLQLNLDAALAAGDLFPGCINWPKTDPFEAIGLLNRCREWAARQNEPIGADGDQDGTEQGEGGTPGNKPRKRITLAEAEILVRDWLKKHAKPSPASIMRDAVAAGTGVSTGMVSNTAAWKAFRERRDAEAKPGAREVPLTETMQAVIPADCARPDELAELIEEQKAEKEAEGQRRHKRRHGS